MKAKVIDNLCIGCGACTYIADEEFEIQDDGLSHAINETVKKENESKVKEAQESCPTSAIELTEE